LSASPEINPLMYNWNKIFVGYCDGSSFSSENPFPVPVLGKDGDHLIENEQHYIYYGGHFILDAVYEMFHRVHRMSTASDVVITGSSAGGLSVIMHIDYLRHKILTKNRAPKKPVVVGVIDGGFFMDVLSIKGQNLMRDVVKGIVAVQNITTNQKCWKNHHVDSTGAIIVYFVKMLLFHF
jgi:O-palmitoleoyl-L-serine hydrolase